MNNEDVVMAQAVKTFQGDEGFKTPESEPFEVSRQRFADLKANGLVLEANAAAAEPQHEQAAEPVEGKPARGNRAKR
jgi:hypothetical protein